MFLPDPNGYGIIDAHMHPYLAEDRNFLFAIPENYTPMLMLPIGYPAPEGTPSERHFKRKGIGELVSFNEL